MDKEVRILSVENWQPPESWSWGITINCLIKELGAPYRFSRIKRGLFQCANPRCGVVFHHPVDKDLVRDYDIVFPHNPDTLKMIPPGDRIVCRVGGLNVDTMQRENYHKEFARVAAIVATNEQLKDIAQTANPHVTVIPNGVDLDHFKPNDPNPDFDRPFTIGFAGNVWGPGADYKGWKFFVEASVKLQALCDIGSMHLLHGANQIPHDQMPSEFYQKIDAIVLPSKGEGCSNVVTEALACGVPPILTKVGYHGEKLTDGVNCLFVPRDADAIIKAVERLVNDRDLRRTMCEQARVFAEAHHDIRVVAQMYDRVFKDVLGRQASE